MDTIREDMEGVGMRTEDTEGKVRWKDNSLWRPMMREQPKKEEEFVFNVVEHMLLHI